jgi:RNA polymerase sigma factor (sigma-70 family)
VQDACIKALRAFESRTGPSTKAWFLAIVRNTCLDALRTRRRHAIEDPFDEQIHGTAEDARSTPEAAAEQASQARWIRAQIARLPAEYREVIVLRELEEMSYKEISAVVKVPVGTVMSRLARGRDLLATLVRAEAKRSPG